MSRILFLTAFALAGTVSAYGTEPEHRHHDAHEHGTAQLNLAWESNTVTLELETPAMNVVGFEHKPRTDAQKKSVENALKALEQADKLFGFTPEAKCHGAVVNVKTDLSQPSSDTKAKGEEHADFDAEYRFTCDAPAALRSVDVHLFKLFPKLQHLNVQIVSATKQSAAELTPSKTDINVR